MVLPSAAEQDQQDDNDCRFKYPQELLATFSAAGRTKLSELRAAGKDPSKGGEVAKRRAAKLVQRMQDQAAWETEHETEADPEVFRREILPHLQDITLSAMAKETGLSEQYCSLIRRGKYVPHSRHWPNLRHLGDRFCSTVVSPLSER